MSVVISKPSTAFAFAVFTNDKVAQPLCGEDLMVKESACRYPMRNLSTIAIDN